MRPRNEELPLAVEIERTEEEIHLYDGIAQAMQEPRAMLDVVLSAEDPDAARTAMRQRFGLDEFQAMAVLNLQFRRATNRDRRRIEERCQELAEHLAFLRDSGRR